MAIDSSNTERARRRWRRKETVTTLLNRTRCPAGLGGVPQSGEAVGRGREAAIVSQTRAMSPPVSGRLRLAGR